MGLKFIVGKNYRNGNNGAPPNILPQYDGYAITPDDNNDLPNGMTNAIYCTGAGNIAVQLPAIGGASGGTATLTVSVGQYVILMASRILTTGTTATGLFALY